MNSREQCGALEVVRIDGDLVEVECWLKAGHVGAHEDFDIGNWAQHDGE